MAPARGGSSSVVAATAPRDDGLAESLQQAEGLAPLARVDYADTIMKEQLAAPGAQVWLFRLPGGLSARDVVGAKLKLDKRNGGSVVGRIERTETQPTTGHKAKVTYELTSEGDASEAKRFVTFAGSEEARRFQACPATAVQVNVTRYVDDSPKVELPSIVHSDTHAPYKQASDLSYYFHPFGSTSKPSSPAASVSATPAKKAAASAEETPSKKSSKKARHDEALASEAASSSVPSTPTKKHKGGK